MSEANIDDQEIAHFERLAARWWDPDGEFGALHRLNPLRANYIDERSPVAGRRVLDVGCGGGLLCEALARRGAEVTGVDLGETAIEAAVAHRDASKLDIEYLNCDADALAEERGGRYHLVCCMELLEHVPDPAALVASCARLVEPGGAVYFSTINRSLQAWLGAVLIGEHVLGLLPKGTHRYDRLIRPSELADWARAAGLTPDHMTGVRYDPLRRRFFAHRRVGINYMMRTTRET